MPKSTCKPCTAFFAKYRCSAATHGECDCPKCQGYCKCQREAVSAQKSNRNLSGASIAAMLAAVAGIDPAGGRVLDALFNSKCVHAGSIGSDRTKNCSEQVAAHGSIGEHVCMNHFDKFLGNKLSSLFNGKETK